MRKMRVALLTAAMVLTVGGSAMAGAPFAIGLPNPGPDNVAVGSLLKFADSWGNTAGGEFVARPAASTSNLGFETFCVQTAEYLDFTSAFKVVGVNTYSLADNKPLDHKTAWVFSQFRAGSLVGYDYSNALGTRATDADALQQLIWQYQGQSGAAIVGKAAGLGGWDALASAAVTLNPADFYNVRVLNLMDSTGTVNKQDVLTIVPEPVFFQMGVLLGMSGLGVLKLRRKA